MRVLLAFLLAGLCAAVPARSQNTTPCPATTRIPVFCEVAGPVCPGEPLRLVARACGPCVDLQGWTFMPPGPIQLHASMDLSQCVTTVCMPESVSAPLGSFAAGHHVVMVELRGTVVRTDGTTCTVVQHDSVEFDVPFACPPRPLPYTDVIRVGAPPPCDSCPPPPICPGREIPFFIAGRFPDTCYEFRGIELLPSPIMGPMPEPPIVRVYVAHNDCLGMPCLQQVVPWQGTALLPPLPTRTYNLIVEMALVGWCDSTRTPDTLYTTLVPFTVAPPCSVPGAPDCYLYAWRPGASNAGCDTYVSPGMPGRAVFQMFTGTVLAGLQGRLVLDPAALRIENLRPAGLAAHMDLAWNPRPDGASFVLFSASGRTFASPCIPPAMCPPTLDPVLEVTVAQRPGVPIPALTRLDATELLAVDSLGREVGACPTFAPVPPARICSGRTCDFNADGHLDVRDLVLMARCVTGRGPCPDSAASRFDCDGDGALGVGDVLCCARVILRGRLPDSLTAQPAPAVQMSVGPPVATAAGLDLPVHLAGADLVGAARLAFAYPADRFDHAEIEVAGAPAGWLEVDEMADGELVIGLVAIAPAEQLSGELDLIVHFGLAAGQAPSTDVALANADFAGPDGAALDVQTQVAGVPGGSPRFQLSPARPNPFGSETRLSVTVASAGRADVAIFDLAGRRVATLHDGPLSAGVHAFRWNGIASDGRRVRDGVYFCRVAGGGALATRRLVFISTP